MMLNPHPEDVNDAAGENDGHRRPGVPTDEDIEEFVRSMDYPLTSEQIATLGSFVRQGQPSLRALRAKQDVPSAWDPFRAAHELRSAPDGSGCDEPNVHSSATPLASSGEHRSSGHGNQDTSVTERVVEVIQRLRVVDAELSSTISFLDERAAELAEESDRRIAAGGARLLEGVPFTVKDVMDVADVPTTGGSRSRISDAPASESAPVIARLEQAGAIPIAKDSTTEFASGGMHTPLKGVCRNPWNTRRSSGGSSSGTAATVASGAVTFGIGTDVSGSVRMPAAFCGVTGLKPTAGRLPHRGVIPMSWSTEVVGPLARDARTLSAVFAVMTGEGLLSPLTSRHSGYGSARFTDLSKFTVAVPRDDLFTDCDSAVLDGLNDMSESLASLGASAFETEIPNAAFAHDAGFQIIYPEALTAHHPHVTDWSGYDGFTIDRFSRGMTTFASDYLRAKQFGIRLREDLFSVLDDADAILVPTVPAAAPSMSDATMCINGKKVPSYAYQSRIAMICSITGFPALTLPTGFDSSGCPVAAMLITRPYREDTALHIAEAFQASTSHHLRKPALPSTDSACGGA